MASNITENMFKSASKARYATAEIEPLLINPNVADSKYMIPMNPKPILFTIKDSINMTHYIVNINEESGKWENNNGMFIEAQIDAPGYQYYLINEEYLECYSDIQRRTTTDELETTRDGYIKYGIDNRMQKTLAFMNLRLQKSINEKLANSQLISIVRLTTIIIFAIFIIIFMVKTHII